MERLCGRRPGWHWVKVSALKNWECGYLAEGPPEMEVDAHNYAQPNEPVPSHRRVVFTPTEQSRVESVGTVHGRWGVSLEPPRETELEQTERIEPGWYWAFLDTGFWVCGRVLSYDAWSGPKGTVFRPAFPFRGCRVGDVLGWVRLCGPDVPDSVALGVEAPVGLEAGAP